MVGVLEQYQDYFKNPEKDFDYFGGGSLGFPLNIQPMIFSQCLNIQPMIFSQCLVGVLEQYQDYFKNPEKDFDYFGGGSLGFPLNIQPMILCQNVFSFLY